MIYSHISVYWTITSLLLVAALSSGVALSSSAIFSISNIYRFLLFSPLCKDFFQLDVFLLELENPYTAITIIYHTTSYKRFLFKKGRLALILQRLNADKKNLLHKALKIE